MDYYTEIKNKLIDNENYQRIKDYSKERHNLQTYYEVGKKYSVRYLFDIRKLYHFLKVHPPGAQLTISHYRILFALSDNNKIDYYINQIINRNLSKRQLEEIIKSKEYERLPEETRNKLIKQEETNIIDYVKNPIIIKSKNNYEVESEKVLQMVILENIPSFLEELGEGFTFIKNEYKIKIGNNYNYIDLLLFNYKYNCFVVVELKVTKLLKEHIGQIQVYMNYIDSHLKSIYQDKTIGIIICKKDNKYVIEYCSDSRIISREYVLKSLSTIDLKYIYIYNLDIE